jgi:hypothetical protein
MPALKEPCRLAKYITTGPGIGGRLFTCGRPGRSMGAKVAKISDEVVDVWLKGLPSSTGETIIVSLLGRKPKGPSEFSYYSFRGGFDQPEDRPGCPTWQEWLNERYGCRYRVCEFPTIDTDDIPESTKKVLFETIMKLMQAGKDCHCRRFWRSGPNGACNNRPKEDGNSVGGRKVERDQIKAGRGQGIEGCIFQPTTQPTE